MPHKNPPASSTCPWRPISGMRIENGQICRPEHFFQITAVGNQGVSAACAEGQVFNRGHGTAVLLHHESYNARQRCEGKEREFLHHQLPRAPGFEAFQGPVIQQQQNTRQRHQHRLAHQSKHETKQSGHVTVPHDGVRIRRSCRLRHVCTYARNIVSIQNSVLNTSLRSVTQATDSTRNGCNPNNAAKIRLRHAAPVICRNIRNTRAVLAA